MSDEETIIGYHTSGIELQEGINISLSRNYCSNCRKKIHCHVKINKETNEAIIINNCKDKDCACKCKTHYACRNCGYLHPYGQNNCNRTELDQKLNAKNEKKFQELMKKWNDQKKSNTVNYKRI